jgi:hypothetical protein
LVRPQLENGSASVSVASRRELDDAITYSTSVAASSEGRASVRSAGRYHRIQITPTGSWIYAIGMDVDFKPQGGR